ncbi:pantoate--beta-alanine ligase [Spongiibacter sp. KMU-158]|uniref:Pantothenate synthetase n=1 Tax=Spongiibacter pelagi TaxID=2760804 RepID=A0A927C4H0_9GAMM|nr:pantoate--beta-alanine ligase [Spongiibacter pelagi]MBD2860003.1 pantoate--beta-alanine ligase [Spongiibacter pelagi]
MKTYSTAEALRSALNTARQTGKSVAFVPTMGNLHEGHISLVRRARQLADVVVVSIFVNPLQFGANEDLDNYPRTITADKEKLFAEGTQYLFLPQVEEIYPEGMEIHSKVCVPELGNRHCGASRPGHFDGVTTVVNKLFNIVQPDVAVFGEKDFQQLSIIRKMVRDLLMPVNVVGVATARAEDGLALSSRNGYLNEEQRQIAPVLHRILQETRQAIACGYDSYRELECHARLSLQAAGFEPDYFNICDARDLLDVTPETEEIVILAAAKLGSTRLIDNVTHNLNPSSDWGMLATN